MSRLVRGTVLALGAAALLTAALTQSDAPAPASTLRSGNHANPAITPITPGLVPSTPKPTPTKESTADNVDTSYDYINSCSLIPLSDIHRITGNQRLLYFGTKGLTSKLSETHASEDFEEVGQYNCLLTSDVEYLKPQLMIAISPHMRRIDFSIRYQQENYDDDTKVWAVWTSTHGLPGADRAYMTYTVVRGERHYQGLFVHTKADQTLAVRRANKQQLRELAVAALRTLNGSRYPGK